MFSGLNRTGTCLLSGSRLGLGTLSMRFTLALPCLLPGSLALFASVSGRLLGLLRWSRGGGGGLWCRRPGRRRF